MQTLTVDVLQSVDGGPEGNVARLLRIKGESEVHFVPWEVFPLPVGCC